MSSMESGSTKPMTEANPMGVTGMQAPGGTSVAPSEPPTAMDVMNLGTKMGGVPSSFQAAGAGSFGGASPFHQQALQRQASFRPDSGQGAVEAVNELDRYQKMKEAMAAQQAAQEAAAGEQMFQSYGEDILT